MDPSTGTLVCRGRQLTSLVGTPPDVRVLYCDHNQLTSLVGCPPTVQILICHRNLLTSLEGCPPGLQELYCDYNLLTSLAGCPPTVKKLYCFNNPLTSLEGCPPGLKVLSCYNNQLTSVTCKKGVPSLKSKSACAVRYHDIEYQSIPRELVVCVNDCTLCQVCKKNFWYDRVNRINVRILNHDVPTYVCEMCK